MATDAQLIQQIKGGKGAAYGQLYHKYYQPIYSICFSILKNSHDAEEAAQETFIQAYLKLNQLRKPSSFFAWLKKIAQNHSKECLRKRRVETIPLDLASAHEDDFIGRQIAPDERLLRQELRESILEAVELLPTIDREIVQARIDGFDHAEISQRFGISYQASRVRLHRARKRIALYVKDLLHAVFGLPKILTSKTITSGGMLAMKVTTSAKLTIGVISVIVAGFAGFHIVTHQDNGPKQQLHLPNQKEEIKPGKIPEVSQLRQPQEQTAYPKQEITNDSTEEKEEEKEITSNSEEDIENLMEILQTVEAIEKEKKYQEAVERFLADPLIGIVCDSNEEKLNGFNLIESVNEITGKTFKWPTNLPQGYEALGLNGLVLMILPYNFIIREFTLVENGVFTRLSPKRGLRIYEEKLRMREEINSLREEIEYESDQKIITQKRKQLEKMEHECAERFTGFGIGRRGRNLPRRDAGKAGDLGRTVIVLGPSEDGDSYYENIIIKN